jgi:hypothetical protein
MLQNFRFFNILLSVWLSNLFMFIVGDFPEHIGQNELIRTRFVHKVQEQTL